MNVLILTEGGMSNGFGHVSRCWAVFQALRESRARVHFCVDGDHSVKGFLGRAPFELRGWRKETGFVKTIRKFDLVIIDSYLAPRQFYARVSDLPIKKAFFDDDMRLAYPPGIVINGSIGAEKLGYRRSNGVSYLLGLRYFPMRKDFWSIKPRPVRKKARRLLVTIGATDMRNMTLEAVRVLSPLRNWNLSVVVRKDAQAEKIRRLRYKNVFVVRSPDAAQMKRQMQLADMAVSACGQTIYELARARVPTVGIGVAENQEQNIRGWKKQGFLRYAGMWTEPDLWESVESCVSGLEPYRQRLASARAGSIIDGSGASRIADALMRAA